MKREAVVKSGGSAAANEAHGCVAVQMADSRIPYFHRGAVYFPEDYSLVLLSSMPRSGTWYTYYLFEFLNLNLDESRRVFPRHGLELYHSAKLAKIHVHSICPGFAEICPQDKLEKWQKMSFISDGYNYSGQFLNDNKSLVSPLENPSVRIIYICRNPLDQITSYFFHCRSHNNQHLRDVFMQFQDVKDFFYKAGLESFIKQYYTFYIVSQRFPANVLYIKYRDLVKEPEAVFRNMVEFSGAHIDQDKLDAAVEFALRQASMGNLRNVEIQQGKSLAGDQTGYSPSHFKSGKPGRWREFMGQAEFDHMAAKLAEFDIPLDNFTFD